MASAVIIEATMIHLNRFTGGSLANGFAPTQCAAGPAKRPRALIVSPLSSKL
jgi:hypothetical protein